MDLLVGTESKVTSEDVQTPNAKGSGQWERRAIQTSSTENAVRRRRRAATPPHRCPPREHHHQYRVRSLVWKPASFGTASALAGRHQARLVLAKWCWRSEIPKNTGKNRAVCSHPIRYFVSQIRYFSTHSVFFQQIRYDINPAPANLPWAIGGRARTLRKRFIRIARNPCAPCAQGSRSTQC